MVVELLGSSWGMDYYWRHQLCQMASLLGLEAMSYKGIAAD